MRHSRGCIVTHKSGVFGEIEGGAWAPLTYDIDWYNQCRPYNPQTTPPRTPAGVYPAEPVPPPPPPPPPPEIIEPVGPDIDGDGEPDEEPALTPEEFEAAVQAACNSESSGGIQWGSVGDKLIINGMGGGGDAQLSGGELAGPSAVNADSILVASGFKVSDNIDAVVQLPGTDFVLSRNFTGEKNWPLGGENLNSAGSGWTMSFDAGVQWDLQPVTYGDVPRRDWQHDARWTATGSSTPGDGFEHMGTAVVAVSPIRDSVMFTNHRWYRSDNGGDPPALPSGGTSRSREVREFTPLGPRMQRLEAGFWEVTYGSTTVKRPAWILKDPGGGTSVFFRSLVKDEVPPTGWSITQSPAEIAATFPATCQDAAGLDAYPDGALWQQIDPAGNVWTYHHQLPSLNGCARTKLTSIVLHGVQET
ncbi:MAG TPA: hypothetical protein VFF65_04115, partial [Phycisphaerales bacterium]|nr:hypothetical protein [Phycisphaerales bacterium]